MNRDEEHYRRLYPDLVANEGVLNWSRKLMNQTPVVAVNGWGPNYAHFQCGTRSAQLSFRVFERQFTFDLWEEGKVLADGGHTDFEKVIEVIKGWVTSTKSAENFEQEAGFVKARSNHPKENLKPGAYLISEDGLKKI